MNFRPLNILIGCEKSGQLRRAFRALGHSAWSCDREPANDCGQWHLRCNVLDAIRAKGWLRSQTGERCFGGWNAVICHPPCTRLCNSGVLRLYVGGKKAGGIDRDKWNAMTEGARFFRECWDACGDIPRGFENPTMHGYASALIGLGTGDQAIQPYEFGDDASKRTVLWLHGLPRLSIPHSDNWVRPRWVCPKCRRVSGDDDAKNWLSPDGRPLCHRCGDTPRLLPRWGNQTDSGQNKLAPSAERAAIRAETYPGIARAIAQQWSAYLLSK